MGSGRVSEDRRPGARRGRCPGTVGREHAPVFSELEGPLSENTAGSSQWSPPQNVRRRGGAEQGRPQGGAGKITWCPPRDVSAAKLSLCSPRVRALSAPPWLHFCKENRAGDQQRKNKRGEVKEREARNTDPR